jgi:hypothetical protein
MITPPENPEGYNPRQHALCRANTSLARWLGLITPDQLLRTATVDLAEDSVKLRVGTEAGLESSVNRDGPRKFSQN